MAFPQVAATGSGNSGANATTHSIDLSGLSLASGDICVVFFTNDSTATASVTTPATGWDSELTQTSTLVRLSVFTRSCDGSEGSSITVTTSASEGGAWVVYRITGGDYTNIESASTLSLGSTPDPPSLTASWGIDDNLRIGVAGWDDGTTAISSYPLPDHNVTDRWNDSGGTGVAVCSDELTAATVNIAAFAIGASERNCSASIVIKPSGAAPSFTDLTTIALHGGMMHLSGGIG
jgi:hypothetical protein